MALVSGNKIKTMEWSAGKGDITTALLDKSPAPPALLGIRDACIVPLELFQQLAFLRGPPPSGPRTALALM